MVCSTYSKYNAYYIKIIVLNSVLQMKILRKCSNGVNREKKTL